MTLVRHSHAGDGIVVSCQEVLTVRIIEVSDYYTAAGNAHKVTLIWMQKHGVVDLTAEAN
jgi:hypothetical protein